MNSQTQPTLIIGKKTNKNLNIINNQIQPTLIIGQKNNKSNLISSEFIMSQKL